MQEGVNALPHNKQAFIYKKNATSTAKAITRKMRQSQIPPALEQQNNNSLTGDLGYPRESASKPTMDATRSSQNEADTIATHGANQSPSMAMSQGVFNRLDSEVIATSEGRPADNKRFHTGYKSKVRIFHHHQNDSQITDETCNSSSSYYTII